MVDVTVKPERVHIAARQDVLDTIRELTLEEIDITGAYNNILSPKNILNAEGLIFLDMKTPPVINIVVEEIIERQFIYNYGDIQFINTNENMDVVLEDTEEKITVTVLGTSTLVNELEKSDLILTADLAETIVGVNTVNLDVVCEYAFNDISLSKESVILEILEASEDPQER